MSRKPGTEKAPHAVVEQSNVIPLRRPRKEISRDSNPLLHEMNPREMTSINALTAYVSHNQNVREDIVRAYVEAEFNVDDIAEIRRKEYERVIAFLVDLRCDLIKN